MDKVRMNQILEILLSPYMDFDFGSKSGFDDLLVKYKEVYNENKGDTIGGKHKEGIRKYNESYKGLMEYYRSILSQPPRNMDDIKLLFELFFPLKEVLSCGEENFFMENIMRIADSLLTFRDGEIAIRTWKNSGTDIFGAEQAFNKVEVWNNLIRIFSPDILVAAFVIKGGYSIDSLYCQGSQICMADKLLNKVIQKGIAETHMHLNAGYEFQEVWEYNMDLSLWLGELSRSNMQEYEDKKQILLYAALIRMDMAYFLEGFGQRSECYQNYSVSRDWRQILDAIRESVLTGKASELGSEKIGDLIREVLGAGEYEGEDYLLHALYERFKSLNCGSEIIFLYQSLQYCNGSNTDVYFTRMFFQYIRIKNIMYRQGVERNEIGGLDRFQEYFAKTKAIAAGFGRKDDFLLKTALLRHMRMQNLRKLEIRIAPHGIVPERGAADYRNIEEELKKALLCQLQRILSLYRKLILEIVFGWRNAQQHLEMEEKEERMYSFSEILDANAKKQVRIPSLGIVFHFLKHNSVDNVTGSFCWQNTDDMLLQYSEHRIAQRKRMENMSRAIEEIRNEIPKLDEYIVGIDAASNENAAEPWDMLPAYTAIRNRRVSRPVLHDQSSQMFYKVSNIGFTYHVGEDFRHPMSGMRHVDEVIEHFRYRSGDRLGHAIVLGLNVDRWVMNNEVVVLKAGEELENYLWLWGKMVHDQWQVPIQVEVLERSIYRIAEDIYDVSGSHNMGNLTIDMLYKAYRLKFSEDHRAILEKYQRDKEEGIFCNSGICELFPSGSASPYQNNWNPEKLLCTQYCPVFVKNCNKSVLVAIHENDAAIFNYIQDKLLGIVEEKGIYIEVNPTSNLAIGEISSMSEHPVFRMNKMLGKENPRNALVTINSDDPSVFATNVANEIAYIYHTLKQEGYKEEDILLWIDKVRNYGLEGSFIREIKSVDVIFDEVTRLLGEIGEKIKGSFGRSRC